MLRTLIMPVLLAALVGCASNGSRDSRASEPWQSLFDGKSLDGWAIACKPTDRNRNFWKVDAGTILCDSIGTKDHDYIWLITRREFDDFELELQVQTFRDSPGNSGVQVRSRYDDEAGWLDGPQIDIHPPAPWRTGFIYDETRETKRWINPSLKNWKIDPSYATPGWTWKHADEGDGWNTIRIVCRGSHITTVVNGVTISNYDGTGVLDDEAHRAHNVGMRGHIALQLHKHDELRIRFRHIRVRTSG